MVILELCLVLIDWLSLEEGRRGSFEIGRPRSRGRKNFGRRWTRGWEVLVTGLENWTILMDVICVSSFKEVKRCIITDFLGGLGERSWKLDNFNGCHMCIIFKEVKRYIITDFRHTSTLTMRKSVRIRSFSGLYFPTFGKIFLHSLW